MASSYFDQFNKGGIPFMEGREKGNTDEFLDENLHIVDYGFINGEDGEYCVMLFAEKEKFFFGNDIATAMLKKVDADGMREELKNQAIRFEMRTSKRGRDYVAFEFVK